MVEQASFVSRELGISREEQDAWAFRSHQRAVAAIDAGRFADEIVPVGELEADESPRRDTSLEKLAVAEAGLRPGGDDDGRQRPGRQRRRLLRARRERGVGAPARASSRSRRSSRRATSPTSSPTSRARPRKAAGVALARAGKTIDDVARVEINEAFASVASHSTRLLGADEEQRERERRRRRARASDRRLRRQDPRRRSSTSCAANGGGLGLAAICSGGGQGDALLIEV